jgi:hypothetical protein
VDEMIAKDRERVLLKEPFTMEGTLIASSVAVDAHVNRLEIYIYTYVRMHLHICTYGHTHIYIYIYIYIAIAIYIYIIYIIYIYYTHLSSFSLLSLSVCLGEVENYLNQLTDTASKTLRWRLEDGIETASQWEVEKDKARDVWLFDYPAQVRESKGRAGVKGERKGRG